MNKQIEEQKILQFTKVYIKFPDDEKESVYVLFNDVIQSLTKFIDSEIESLEEMLHVDDPIMMIEDQITHLESLKQELL